MTTIKDFADIGDANAPIGSPEWCKYAHGVLCSSKRRTNSEVSNLKYALLEFRKNQRWQQLVNDNGKPFVSWEDYVQYPEPSGLGMPPASAKLVMEELDDSRLLGDVLVRARRNQAIEAQAPELQPVGTNQYGDGGRDKKSVPTSRAAAYDIARLRRDRPDILPRVLAGEISANAGMVEAGFRKPAKSRRKSPLERILKLLPELTPAERAELRRRLTP